MKKKAVTRRSVVHTSIPAMFTFFMLKKFAATLALLLLLLLGTVLLMCLFPYC